jgi:two-component system, OmpR family, phosphate regulon response regulator PhoB
MHFIVCPTLNWKAEPGVPTKKNILVVEDEADLAELVCFNLQREGYDCRCVADARAALEEVKTRHPDLIVLDRMLPGLSGDAVAKQLKSSQATNAIPILMLTAKVEESAQLTGFALGADDYVTKPFSTSVLIARINAILRRTTEAGEAGDVITVGPVHVDVARHEVIVSGLPVQLTATEFGILRVLMSAKGRVLDRDKLISSVLGPTVAVTDRTIDVHIAALRKKLGDGANWIQTIRGAGYTFRAPAVSTS